MPLRNVLIHYTEDNKSFVVKGLWEFNAEKISDISFAISFPSVKYF